MRPSKDNLGIHRAAKCCHHWPRCLLTPRIPSPSAAACHPCNPCNPWSTSVRPQIIHLPAGQAGLPTGQVGLPTGQVGHAAEIGYIDLNELATSHGRMGIGIEIDMHFKPQTIAACREDLAARAN